MAYSLSIKARKAFQLSMLSLALSVAGCGGGETIDVIAPMPSLGVSGQSDNGSSTDPVDNETYNLYLSSDVNAIGLDRGSMATVTARVVDEDFGVASSQEVIFSITDPGLTGVFNVDSAKLITNEKGIATINLEVLNTLSEEQKTYLKNTGITISATLGTGDVEMTLKGTEDVVAITKDDIYDIFISTSKNQLATGSDSLVLNVRVTDKSGGIKAGVPVNMAIVDPKKYGFSFDGSSSQISNDQGLVSIGLIQNNTGIASQLNHETSVIITVDDGENAASSQTIPIIASGAEVVDVTLTSSVIAEGDKVTLIGALVDGSGSPISNAPVMLINEGNEVASGNTDDAGHFEFTDITSSQLTIDEGEYVLDLKVNPTGEVSQTFDSIGTLVASTSQNITLVYDDIVVNEDGNIVVTVPNGAGKEITLSTTKGQFSNDSSVQKQILDGSGMAIFTVNSNVPGIATIEATYNGETQTKNLQFVSINAEKLLVQADRVLLGINSSTKLSARVLDGNDAPVANAIVEFTAIKDGSGGQLSKGVVQTDATGLATVTYTAGGNPTAANGVNIVAKVSGVELPNGSINFAEVDNVITRLTVQTTASTIGFGLADKVAAGDSNIYYFWKGSVFVNNNNGQPAANQAVTLAVRPNFYLKGFWRVITNDAGEKAWAMFSNPDVAGPAVCDNEDINFNSILDLGEDENQNGRLEPGFIATILVDDQPVVSNGGGVYELTTNNKGRVDFTIRYPKEYSSWMEMTMSAATTVDGTEATQQRVISFPVLEEDVDIEKGRRPDLTSPFGTQSDCKNPN